MKLSCPSCKTKVLLPCTISGDLLYKCSSCHGLWFNGEGLRDVEELPDSQLMIHFQDQLDGSSIMASKTAEADWLCPQCGKPMDSYQYDVSSGVWIHGCPVGDGVWLDKGGILKIHRYLHEAVRTFSPETLKQIQSELKQIEIQHNRKQEEAVLAVFGDHYAQNRFVPIWHAMDGVSRFLYHILFKLGV